MLSPFSKAPLWEAFWCKWRLQRANVYSIFSFGLFFLVVQNMNMHMLRNSWIIGCSIGKRPCIHIFSLSSVIFSKGQYPISSKQSQGGTNREVFDKSEISSLNQIIPMLDYQSPIMWKHSIRASTRLAKGDSYSLYPLTKKEHALILQNFSDLQSM